MKIHIEYRLDSGKKIQQVLMHSDADIMGVMNIDENPVLIGLVDYENVYPQPKDKNEKEEQEQKRIDMPDNPMDVREFQIIEFNEEVTFEDPKQYLGTVSAFGGNQVWHIYEILA